MSVPAVVVRIRRILMALDATARTTAALEESARLAAQLNAELCGLFVEDVNLLRLAALPFARETGGTSASTRRLEDHAMLRALRAQAQQARTVLDAAAARRGVVARFAVARGQVAAELIAAAREADLMVLALARREPPGARVRAVMAGTAGRLLLLREGSDLRPPVVAVHDGTPTGDKTVAEARDFARGLGVGEIVVLTPRVAATAGSARPGPGGDEAGQAGVTVRLRAVGPGDEAMAAEIRRQTPGVLVVGRRHEPLVLAALTGGSAVLLLR